jgi:ELWxxDGT repeat protein
MTARIGGHCTGKMMRALAWIAFAALLAAGAAAETFDKLELDRRADMHVYNVLGTLNGRGFVVTHNPEHGLRIRSTNGTTGGTRIVSVDHSPGAKPLELHLHPFSPGITALGKIFYWRVTADYATQLWRTNNSGDCVLLIQYSPRPFGGTKLNFAEIGGTVYVAGDDGSLYRTDGSVTGTERLADLEVSTFSWFPTIKALGDRLYFGFNGPNGVELHSMDTNGVIGEVANINPDGSSWPWLVGVINEELYFFADDGVHGIELWKTDGTALGTQMLADMTPGNDSSWLRGNWPAWTGYWSSFSVSDGFGYLFIEGEGGWQGADDRISLWRTDGTVSGTLSIMNSLGAARPVWYIAPTFVRGRLYFAAQSPLALGGSQLWSTDGTPRGTRREAAELEGTWHPNGRLVELNGALYFTLATFGPWSPQTVRTLWRYDPRSMCIKRVDEFNEDVSLELLEPAGSRLLVRVIEGDSASLWYFDDGKRSSNRPGCATLPAPGPVPWFLLALAALLEVFKRRAGNNLRPALNKGF